MPATLYRSTDSGAPVLAGNTAGTLIGLLDAILVTGYGSKAPAGWTKPFTDTNVAVFRNGPAAVARRYFRISDPQATIATIRGYYDMTDANTGTGNFPMASQTQLGVRKTDSSDTNPRAWFAVADERTLFIGIDYKNTSYYPCCYLGDAISFSESEGAFAVLSASQYSTSNYPICAIGTYIDDFGTLSDTTFTTMFIGGNGAVAASITAAIATCTGMKGAKWGGATTALPSRFGFPNFDGSLILHPAVVIYPTSYTGPVMTMRGRLRFFYMSPHVSNAFGSFDTVNGTGELAGKTFYLFRTLSTDSYSPVTTFVNYVGAVTLDD